MVLLIILLLSSSLVMVKVLVLTVGPWVPPYTSHMEDGEARQVEIYEQFISTKLICPDYFSLELGDLVTRLLSRHEENRLGNIILYIIITITNIFRCQMSKSVQNLLQFTVYSI